MMLKRIGSFLIALSCIALLFSACKTEQPQIPNPIVNVDGPEALVPVLGAQLRVPEDAADASYSIIGDKIAQIRFTYEGNAYSYRAAKAAGEDISGIYDALSDRNVAINLESDGASTAILLRFLSDGSGALATWSIGENMFTLFSSETADEDTLSYVATGLARLVLAGAPKNTPAA